MKRQLLKSQLLTLDPDNKADLKEKNIIDVSNNCKDIQKGVKKALSNNFNKKIKNIKNPYGSGGSSKKIVQIIKNLKFKKIKTQKQNTY